MKHTFTFLLIAGIQSIAIAQQYAVTTQFWNTQLQINPATAGLEYRHAAQALYRNQWDRVNGAPNYLMTNYAARMDRIHGAAGISYTYGKIGFNRSHTILGHYAFHLPIGKNKTLSFGISGGILNQRSNPDWVPPNTTNDPLLPAGSSSVVFTSNAGIAFQATKWNAGFSVTNLTAPILKQSSTMASGNTNYTTARHYFLHAGYTFDLAENWSLIPRAIAVTDGVNYVATLSVMTMFRNLWTGFNYRTLEMMGVMAGYDFKGRYRVGYSYDYTINQLSSVSKGSHEIVLTYLLK